MLSTIGKPNFINDSASQVVIARAASELETAEPNIHRLLLVDRPGLKACIRISGELADSFVQHLSDTGSYELIAAVHESALSSFTVHNGTEPSSPQGPIFTAGPEVPCSQVLSLSNRLRSGTDADRSRRISDAYQLGRQDSTSEVPLLPSSEDLANSVAYIVLAARNSPEPVPFWTRSKSRYYSAVRPSDNIDVSSRSRVFKSVAELHAYLAGLGSTPPIKES